MLLNTYDVNPASFVNLDELGQTVDAAQLKCPFKPNWIWPRLLLGRDITLKLAKDGNPRTVDFLSNTFVMAAEMYEDEVVSGALSWLGRPVAVRAVLQKLYNQGEVIREYKQIKDLRGSARNDSHAPHWTLPENNRQKGLYVPETSRRGRFLSGLVGVNTSPSAA